MRAAVMTAFRQPLEVRDVPDPQPGDNDAVVRVEACGVCRSDWHLWQEDWSWLGVGLTLPAVPGHEIGGVVEHVGKNVKRFQPGDRVTIPFHLACGACEYCWTGRSNICQAFGFVGAHTSGGYGELTPVPNADMNLVRLPDGVAPTTAAGPRLLARMLYVTAVPAVTEATPLVFVMARSAVVGGNGTIVSVSVAVLLPGFGSVTPAGAVTVAVFASVPLAAGDTVAFTV